MNENKQKMSIIDILTSPALFEIVSLGTIIIFTIFSIVSFFSRDYFLFLCQFSSVIFLLLYYLESKEYAALYSYNQYNTRQIDKLIKILRNGKKGSIRIINENGAEEIYKFNDLVQ